MLHGKGLAGVRKLVRIYVQKHHFPRRKGHFAHSSHPCSMVHELPHDTFINISESIANSDTFPILRRCSAKR